jgi:hypothetical protein
MMQNVDQKSLRQWNSIRSYQLKVQIALNYEEWSKKEQNFQQTKQQLKKIFVASVELWTKKYQ